MLTSAEHSPNLSKTTTLGGFDMEGGIYCNYCSKRMTKPVCSCGRVYCHIRYYHSGKPYYRRKLPNGKSLTYDAALDILATISVDKRKGHKPFEPIEFSDTRAKELLFATQIKLWLKEQEQKKSAGELKPSYYNRLRSYDKVHFIRLYNMPMQDIGKREIASFKVSLDHLKIHTRKNIMSALHTFFLWFEDQAEELELIHNYTIPSFPRIKGKDARITYALYPEAQQTYLQEIPERHRDIIEFAMVVGCRRGEVTAYKVKDVDLKNETIHTVRGWSDHELSTPKNGEPSDKILFGRAIEIARRNMKDKTREAWLFVNPDTGNYYQPKKIDELWAMTSADVRFHEATRHSFITQLLEEGIEPKFVSIMAGHKDLQSMKPYDHVQLKNIKAMIYKKRGSCEGHAVENESK
jgi:integrase